MGLLIPLEILIPIALVVMILIVLLWILFSKNKNLYQKITSERKRFSLYKRHIEHLKNFPQNPEKDFNMLNQLARAFFKEYFELDYSLTYLELAENFKKQNKQTYANFCELMSNANYSGEKTDEQIQQVVTLFYEIINSY